MDYARLVETALRLIKKNGQAVTWRVTGDPVSSDATKPWLASAADASTDFDCFAVFLPMKSLRSPFLSMMKDATDVPAGSETVLIAGNSDFEPAMNDLCLRNDANGNPQTHRIVRLNTLRPATTSVLHILVMSR